MGMKKAVLYARVSSDLQKKERAIDSQIVALKKPNRWPGWRSHQRVYRRWVRWARLDRPGLDQLLRDLKTSLFDTIYFLNADRIARDVTNQTIIIAEILKHQKQIIINGKRLHPQS
jgi:site-specific DNA recombinase